MFIANATFTLAQVNVCGIKETHQLIFLNCDIKEIVLPVLLLLLLWRDVCIYASPGAHFKSSCAAN